MGLFDSIRDAKNAMLGSIVTEKANKIMEGFGKMLNFQLDTENSNIYFEIMLKGESVPIKMSLSKYEFIQKDNKLYIKFQDIKTSREWLDAVLKQYVLPKYAPKHEFELPQSLLKYRSFLNIIM